MNSDYDAFSEVGDFYDESPVGFTTKQVTKPIQFKSIKVFKLNSQQIERLPEKSFEICKTPIQLLSNKQRKSFQFKLSTQPDVTFEASPSGLIEHSHAEEEEKKQEITSVVCNQLQQEISDFYRIIQMSQASESEHEQSQSDQSPQQVQIHPSLVLQLGESSNSQSL